MASGTGSIWAVDIGNNALKALCVVDTDRGPQVEAFECISYGKILSGSGVKPVEREELIAFALRQLVKNNNITKDDVVVAVPGQNSFARFVKLPPLDKKQIPEMIKYEAAQQIPFDINDVQWDWQLMTDPDDPEAKVGLFAIKSDIVANELEFFARENLQVSCVQMVPMALYNYLVFDRPELTKSDSKATIVINIGAENSDLIVCTNTMVWQRTIPMGGNAFTRAIADTFKLNFAKAEKLKRTAAMSKYARQIFQAMKPVFTDFAAEVQRSLGFYSSSNPNTKFAKLVALGGGIKMRGLLKYLQQTLQIPVEAPDVFKKLIVDSEDQAKFHKNVSDFAIVYGLAIQKLGLAKIESNLLPKKTARLMNWKKKTKIFTLAASILLVVAVLSLLRANMDRVSYNSASTQRNRIKAIINDVQSAKSDVEQQQEKTLEAQQILQDSFQIFKYRDVIPQLHETIISVMPSAQNNPSQKNLYNAFMNNQVDEIIKTPRNQRKQVFITEFSANYVPDVQAADFDSARVVKKTKTESLGVRELEYAPPGARGDFAPRRPQRSRSSSRSSDEEELVEETGPGFVVIISGYTPYKDILELFDPVGVENTPQKWGVITRLMNLDKLHDPNYPFELYQKINPQHFTLTTGVVSLNSQQMPDNIGVVKLEKDDEDTSIGRRRGSRKTEGSVLVDPMTSEVIGQQPMLDNQGQPMYDRSGKKLYQANDHWFILKAKFLWKQAPGAQGIDAEPEQDMDREPPSRRMPPR